MSKVLNPSQTSWLSLGVNQSWPPRPFGSDSSHQAATVEALSLAPLVIARSPSCLRLRWVPFPEPMRKRHNHLQLPWVAMAMASLISNRPELHDSLYFLATRVVYG